MDKLSSRIGTLLQEIYYLLDDSEECHTGTIVDTGRIDRIQELTESIEFELPEKPGYVKSYPLQVQYAIEQLENKISEPLK